MLHNKSLGNQSLAIIYIVFALANFIAPPIVEKIGVRPAMLVVREEDGGRAASCSLTERPPH